MATTTTITTTSTRNDGSTVKKKLSNVNSSAEKSDIENFVGALHSMSKNELTDITRERKRPLILA